MPLTSLPTELIIEIIEHVHPLDMLSLALASRQLHDASAATYKSKARLAARENRTGVYRILPRCARKPSSQQYDHVQCGTRFHDAAFLPAVRFASGGEMTRTVDALDLNGNLAWLDSFKRPKQHMDSEKDYTMRLQQFEELFALTDSLGLSIPKAFKHAAMLRQTNYLPWFVGSTIRPKRLKHLYSADASDLQEYLLPFCSWQEESGGAICLYLNTHGHSCVLYVGPVGLCLRDAEIYDADADDDDDCACNQDQESIFVSRSASADSGEELFDELSESQSAMYKSNGPLSTDFEAWFAVSVLDAWSVAPMERLEALMAA